jgi:hypothetical protein
VLFIHDDDNRNVPFQQTTDLVEKLRAHSDGQGPEVCPSRKAAGHFQTVTNSDLRL